MSALLLLFNVIEINSLMLTPRVIHSKLTLGNSVFWFEAFFMVLIISWQCLILVFVVTARRP